MTLTDSTQQLYDAIAPLMRQDAENGNAGEILCTGFGTMLDPVAELVRDGDLPGWAPVFDLDNREGAWLDWTGQFVGEQRPAGVDDAAMRTLIRHPANFKRATPDAIKVAVQATLTGTKTVLLNFRVGGNWWKVTCATFTSETPDPQATQNALAAQSAAWWIVTYSTVTGGSYATLAASHASYTLMEAAHATYSDIPVNPAA